MIDEFERTARREKSLRTSLNRCRSARLAGVLSAASSGR
jgi:hypothetical protein